MIQASRKLRLAVILISVWTIVQIIFRMTWVIYSYLLLFCSIKPEQYDVVFMYLTYLYKESCGPIHLKKDTLFMDMKTSAAEDGIFSNETMANVLYYFVNDTLDRAILPPQGSVVGRSELYLDLLFIVDVVWFVSAICLFVGAFYKTKQKYLPFIFYGPWLLCCPFVNFLDVASSVHYGLDLIYIKNYSSWLKFVGVTNYNDFLLYDQHSSSRLMSTFPTTVVISLLSRAFFVWLLNIICFFYILFRAIPELFVRTTARTRSRPFSEDKLRFETGGELNLNSSEARIRNWQLFYGAIESNSTLTNSSPGTSAGTGNTDPNLNTKSRKTVAAYDSDINYDNSSSGTPPLDQKSNVSLADSGFRRFSDVANEVATLPIVDTNNINILKGHMPWSYISPEGQYVRHQYTYASKPIRKKEETLDTEENIATCTRL